MSFLEDTYFRGELLIPNLHTFSGPSAVNNVIAAQQKLLDIFISKYEKKFLTELLGYDLYEKFVKETHESDIKDVLPEWKMLKNKLFNSKEWISPAANYVYYWYMANNMSSTSGIGEVRALTNNAELTSPIPKMIKAWNEMVDMNKEFEMWIVNNNVYDYRHIDSDLFYKLNVFGI